MLSGRLLEGLVLFENFLIFCFAGRSADYLLPWNAWSVVGQQRIAATRREGCTIVAGLASFYNPSFASAVEIDNIGMSYRRASLSGDVVHAIVNEIYS